MSAARRFRSVTSSNRNETDRRKNQIAGLEGQKMQKQSNEKQTQPKQGQGQEASAKRVENESEASRRTQSIPRSRQGEAPGSNLFIFSDEKKNKKSLVLFRRSSAS